MAVDPEDRAPEPLPDVVSDADEDSQAMQDAVEDDSVVRGMD